MRIAAKESIFFANNHLKGVVFCCYQQLHKVAMFIYILNNMAYHYHKRDS